MRAWLPAVLLLSPLLAGCLGDAGLGALQDAGPALAVLPPLVDPLAPGPMGVAFADYDAGEVVVGGADANHSDYEYDARLRGRVWWPEAEGRWPLLVLLHGQHGTCAMGEQEALLAVDDCGDSQGVNTPYPNHLGYAYLAEHLASHGYVVASVLAHEVNRLNGRPDVGMWARGELVLATLDAFRDGADGVPAEALARADVARAGLMGHSRGGEGVVTAVHVNLARPEAERHALRAVVALAPTDFNGLGVPDVPLLSLVPYCDGDVSTLHGLRTFDHSRHLDAATPKVQVLVRGTNHNFYNSRWYDATGTPAPAWPGDDALYSPTPSCLAPRGMGGWRWTPEETQRESLVHVAGFLRWQAGGETGLAPWFTGDLGLPDAACPAGPLPCEQAVVVTSVLPGALRLLVVEDAVPEAHVLGGPVELAGFAEARACEAEECDASMRSSAPALDLSWTGEATLSLRFPEGADWSAFDALSVRVAVPGWDGVSPPPMDVSVNLVSPLSDAAVPASAYSTALQRTPDPVVAVGPLSLGTSKLALQAVRIPLDAFGGVDASDVRELRFTFRGEGRAFVTDVLVQAEPDVAAP